MTTIINAVRDLIRESQKESMTVNEILKAVQKNRAMKVGQLDRDELITTINYYKSLSVLYFDENETILFL
jgi:hypothetical protein